MAMLMPPSRYMALLSHAILSNSFWSYYALCFLDLLYLCLHILILLASFHRCVQVLLCDPLILRRTPYALQQGDTLIRTIIVCHGVGDRHLEEFHAHPAGKEFVQQHGSDSVISFSNFVGGSSDTNALPHVREKGDLSEEWVRRVDRDDMAAIMYTSGKGSTSCR